MSIWGERVSMWALTMVLQSLRAVDSVVLLRCSLGAKKKEEGEKEISTAKKEQGDRGAPHAKFHAVFFQ